MNVTDAMKMVVNAGALAPLGEVQIEKGGGGDLRDVQGVKSKRLMS